MDIRIDLNEPQILAKVQSDRFGLFVAQQWKKQIDPYTSRHTGQLMQNIKFLPFQIHYKEKYAKYVYENTRGVTFVTKGTGRNPNATDHWDIAAAQAGKVQSLTRTLNNALQSGQF